MKTVEIITQLAGRYCQSSFSLAYAHIWCTVVSYIALPVGVVAVIQFYLRIRHEPHVRIHRTSQKIWAFKGVLLLNFFQDVRNFNRFDYLSRLMTTDYLHLPRSIQGFQGYQTSHVTRLSNWHTSLSSCPGTGRRINVICLGFSSQALQRIEE